MESDEEYAQNNEKHTLDTVDYDENDHSQYFQRYEQDLGDKVV